MKSKEEAPKAGGWISVKDQTPQGKCLMIGYQSEMIIGYCGQNSDGKFYCETEHEILNDVTHWMPLPEPPSPVLEPKDSKTVSEEGGKVERFKKPTDKEFVDFAILFNDGKLETEKLADMVAMAEFMIDRLYENGNVNEKSSKEN